MSTFVLMCPHCRVPAVVCALVEALHIDISYVRLWTSTFLFGNCQLVDPKPGLDMTQVLTRYSPAAVHWGAAPAAAAAAAVPAVQPAVPSRTRWLPSESHDSVVTCCATMAALCKGVSGAPSFLPDSGRNAKRGFSFGA